MKLCKISGPVLLAVLASATIMAPSSFALPELLPQTAQSEKWTGANVGEPKFETEGAPVLTCKKFSAEGEGEAGKALGKMHITFEKCTTVAGFVTCTSSGDASGSILALGTYHLVFDSLSPLGAAILFLLKPVTFKCSSENIEKKGNVLCLVLEPTSSKVTHEFHCNSKKAVPEETKYYNESGTLVSITELLVDKNGGTFMPAAVNDLATVTYARAVEIMS